MCVHVYMCTCVGCMKKSDAEGITSGISVSGGRELLRVVVLCLLEKQQVTLTADHLFRTQTTLKIQIAL